MSTDESISVKGGVLQNRMRVPLLDEVKQPINISFQVINQHVCRWMRVCV